MTPESLRPKGTVEVTCAHAGCGMSWWLDPLDPKVHGPHDCGTNHGQRRILDRQLARIRLRHGFLWGRMHSDVPPKPEDHVCHLDTTAATVFFNRRDGRHKGTLSWKSFDEIADADADELAARIVWRDPVDAPTEEVRLVGYKDLDADKVRRYALLTCNRCQCDIYVDYDDPGHRPSSYAVGWYGEGIPATAPTPPWAGTLTCESALSYCVKSPQPCAFVHGHVMTAIDAATPWTIWSHDPNAGIAVAFFDRVRGLYGLLIGRSTPSLSACEAREGTFWGSPAELLANYLARDPRIRDSAVLEVLRTIVREEN